MTSKEIRETKCMKIEMQEMGKDFIYSKERIKDEQCCNCSKRKNLKNCRLVIENNECINYKEKRKRNR